MNNENIVIRETDDYMRLAEMMTAKGLEMGSEGAPTDILECWEAVDLSNHRLAGGAILGLRLGQYVLDGIATEDEYRGIGLGAALFEVLLKRAKAEGAARLWLVARAPDFFRKLGFSSVPMENSLGLFDCDSCPQRGSTCFPEAMYLDVRAQN